MRDWLPCSMVEIAAGNIDRCGKESILRQPIDATNTFWSCLRHAQIHEENWRKQGKAAPHQWRMLQPRLISNNEDEL